MSENFSQAERKLLSGPHVQRAWLLEANLPMGLYRLHSGGGRQTIDGKEWRGVTDPLSGRIVSINGIEEARFGSAPAIQLTLTGANAEFLRSVDAAGESIEGSLSTIYFAMFDAETETIIGKPIEVFSGIASSPSIAWQNIGVRTFSMNIESRWAGQNYSFARGWSAAEQRKRYPTDKGFDFVGVETAESFE